MNSRRDETKAHWENVYKARKPGELSWHQEVAGFSLRLIRETGATLESRIVDVGGGASCLARDLLNAGFEDITVVDMSDEALAVARRVLGERAGKIHWREADVTVDPLGGPYDVWHDRAVFHFLVDEDDRVRYRDALLASLSPEGHVIIGTFALDGPERCSGLTVARYDAARIQLALGPGLKLLDAQRQVHMTPAGGRQQFAWFRLRRSDPVGLVR